MEDRLQDSNQVHKKNEPILKGNKNEKRQAGSHEEGEEATFFRRKLNKMKWKTNAKMMKRFREEKLGPYIYEKLEERKFESKRTL